MLSRILHSALRVAALSLIGSTPSLAHRIEVGTGVFCATEKQVERFVAVFDGDARAAIDVVNAEENDPTACVLGSVADIGAAELATGASDRTALRLVAGLAVGLRSQRGVKDVSWPR